MGATPETAETGMSLSVLLRCCTSSSRPSAISPIVGITAIPETLTTLRPKAQSISTVNHGHSYYHLLSRHHLAVLDEIRLISS